MRHSIDQRHVLMAVVVQRMVFPDAAGVMFTADPVTSNRKIVSIEATFGLGEALVSGRVNPDVYTVRDGEIIKTSVGTKAHAILASPGGGTHEEATDAARQKQRALADAQVVRLAQVGRPRWEGGRIVGGRWDEVAAVEHRLQCVSDERVAAPHDLQKLLPARGGRQAFRHVDEQPPAGRVHWRERGQLPHGKPQRSHGVGHHLLVADGHVDVVLAVVARWDGEHRGDRPALDDLEVVAHDAPLDVLRATEVPLDPAAQLRQPYDLGVRQRSLLLSRRVGRLFVRAASG